MTPQNDRLRWLAVWRGYGWDYRSIVLSPTCSIETTARDWDLFRAPLRMMDANLFEHADQTANMIWPDDRSWFLATDIDLNTTYIGGSEALVQALHGWGPSKGKDAYLEIGDGTLHTARKARTLDTRQMKRARDSLWRVWRHERRRYSVGLICEEYQCPCHLWIPQGGRLVGLRCVRQEATRGDIERSLISTHRPSMNAKGRLLREALRQFGRGWSVSRLRPTSSLRLYRVVQGARDP